ncbi:archaetidylserine decarboxylase [uncultured Amphritea sp.]|uniref:archaetidylserine decarboxylase n=1 Tax=uncultured Amphritea sp. TaxID=981605 RepID=UPI002616A72C|nr:archaetidylserine decarboxylase [uncultured Amphritea sp.]
MKDSLFILLQHLLPQHLLSRAVGYLAESRCNWIKRPFIKTFAKQYQVNMSEALIEDLDQFDNFNAFFTRALKPDMRPLDNATVVSPADGAISQIGAIDYGRILQAKGRGYGLSTLLGGHADLAEEFIHGRFATIYLSPSDYHRVHMPVTGTLRESIYVPGDLYSVNQTTAKGVDNLFARNERLVAIFDTEQGPMAMILVGAMIVAGIETVWGGQVAPVQKHSWRIDHQKPVEPVILQQGEEMGRFKLGSTVILLFGKDAIEWSETLKADDPVRLGQAISGS